MQLFQYEQQAHWSFIISHVSNEVIHHIQLDVTYADIDKHKDTVIYVSYSRKVLSLNFQSPMNGQSLKNLLSIRVISPYLNKSQGFLDSLKSSPSEPTEIGKS